MSKEIFPRRIIQTPNKVGLFNSEDTRKGAYLGTENGDCLSMDFLTALAIFPSKTAPLTLKIVLHTLKGLVVGSSLTSVCSLKTVFVFLSCFILLDFVWVFFCAVFFFL